MEDSCQPKKETMNKMVESFSSLALSLSNPAIKDEISEIKEAILDGMRLRSGFVKRGGRRRYSKKMSSQKRMGGMPPKRMGGMMPSKRMGGMMPSKRMGGMMPSKRKADGEEEIVLTSTEKNKLLNAIAHIIATGTLTGGGGALICYIFPAIEAYLAGKGWLPMLCTNSVEWSIRLLVGSVTSIETCQAIQQRYELIVTQIIAAIGIPTGLGLLASSTTLMSGYMVYKNAIYNILNTCVDNIKQRVAGPGEAESSDAVFTSEAGPSEAGPSDAVFTSETNLTQEQIKVIVDEAIQKELGEFLEPGSAGVSATRSASPMSLGYAPSMIPLENDQSRETTPEPGQGYFGSDYGGARRRRRRRKTAKKHAKKTRKTRKHRSRRHQ